MEQKVEIKFPLVLFISLFIHLFILFAIVLPYYSGVSDKKSWQKKLSMYQNRDIIVNINQDNISDIKKYTFLSDKDSKAKGFLTKEKGNNWLNNSLKFKVKKGGYLAGKTSTAKKTKGDKEKVLLSKKSDIEVTLLPYDKFYSSYRGNQGDSEWTKIPDKKGINLKNAIFYSNSGQFSFNTKKFKNFRYFHKMKNKISQNWYPPVNANRILPSRSNPITGGYTPGYTRIMIVPSQVVKLYFTMNRSGTVQKVVIVDSRGNLSLDDSCIEAIKNSKNFGKVPSNIPGETVVIPFMFGYFIR